MIIVKCPPLWREGAHHFLKLFNVYLVYCMMFCMLRYIHNAVDYMDLVGGQAGGRAADRQARGPRYLPGGLFSRPRPSSEVVG